MAKASSYFQQVRQSTHDEPKAPTGTTCVTVFRAPRFLTGFIGGILLPVLWVNDWYVRTWNEERYIIALAGIVVSSALFSLVPVIGPLMVLFGIYNIWTRTSRLH